MKAIKYLVMGALTLGFSTSMMAQDGSKADVDAVKRIISSKPGDLDKQLKPYYKANKKNAENLVAFARAFFEARDTANAREYANYALQASKNKCAPAYILLGDMEALYDNGGAAAAQYEQAIYADPKLVEAYYKYALVYRKIDPRGAAAKLDELKIARPDISIDALKGHIFMLADDRKSAYNEFKKVPVNQINPDYLNEFARASYFGGHFEDAVIACEEGLKHKPNNPAFTRLAMFSNYELKKYDEANKYLHKYFNEIDKDSVKYSEYDHYYAALIHEALGNKDNAKDSYHKALELVDEKSIIKRWDILKTLSTSHKKDGDLENAIKYYNEFLSCKPELKVDWPTSTLHLPKRLLMQQSKRTCTRRLLMHTPPWQRNSLYRRPTHLTSVQRLSTRPTRIWLAVWLRQTTSRLLTCSAKRQTAARARTPC